MAYKGNNPRPQGGAGAKKCNNCGRNGHLANECRDKKKGGAQSQKCNNCGRNGHLANECRDKKKGQQNNNPKKCTNCDKNGHLANECRSMKKGQQNVQDKTPSRPCKHCQETGHWDSSCPTLVENGGTKTVKFSQAGSWMNEDLPITHGCSICERNHQTSNCPNRTQQQITTYMQTTAEVNALLIKALNHRPGNETDIVNQWRAAYPYLPEPQIQQQSQQYVQFQAQAPVINAQPLVMWDRVGESFQNMQIAAPYEETSMTGRSYVPAQAQTVLQYDNFGAAPDAVDRDGDVVMGEWDYIG